MGLPCWLAPMGIGCVRIALSSLAEFKDPDPDYDATLSAVKNLGFIKFKVGRFVY